MGGRGTYAAGNHAPFTYKTVGMFHGIKVLEGLGGKHNLPEEAPADFPELVELVHKVADEILLREMQAADDGK